MEFDFTAETNYLYMRLVTSNNGNIYIEGWFGIGFGSSMANADMIVVTISGSSLVIGDYFSNSHN